MPATSPLAMPTRRSIVLVGRRAAGTAPATAVVCTQAAVLASYACVLLTDGGAGHVRGPVCRLDGPEEMDRLVPGGVLVADSTDPAWLPLLGAVRAKSAGLILAPIVRCALACHCRSRR